MTPIREAVLAFAPELQSLVIELRHRSGKHRTIDDFPLESICRLSDMETDFLNSNTRTLQWYVSMSFGCMTTAFVMTQRYAAIRRIQSSTNESARSLWIDRVENGDFATVGFSHLTTSRRHLSVPSLRAEANGDRWTLTGLVPWVTGAAHADILVVGAVSERDGDWTEQHLFAVPTDNPHLRLGRGLPLLALTSSCTDQVELLGVEVDRCHHLHGPHANVISISSPGGGAGGFQTSALALGLAATAIEYLFEESVARPTLLGPAQALMRPWQSVYEQLMSASATNANSIRKQANDLALQATQAAMATAKGAGFIDGHPVGRWCREAMFFLVWSCPQIVADAHLCSFSNLEESPGMNGL